jgi:hypothetical protein
MANMKTAGLRVLLEQLVAGLPDPQAASTSVAEDTESAWQPTV